MKVIFLDVDGVLNNFHTRTVTSDGWCFVDGFLVERLRTLVKASGAKVILSSTWRDGWNREDESQNELCFIELRDALREHDIEIFDALPLPLRMRRSIAIREFFEKWKGEPIEEFVILDDWNDLDEFTDHLVWTNPRFGLTNDDVAKALKILKS